MASRAEFARIPTQAELAALPVTLADIQQARERISPHIQPSPLLRTRTIGEMSETRLWLKAENLQRTGSFKIRGALNAILQLTPEQRARGVITMSAGNHGQGLAYAASLANVRCVVFMPENATPTKVAAIRGYGAEARFAPTMQEVYAAMDAFREEHGLYYVHPFGDPAIMAGQGTVALEILESLPDVEAITLGVGGGGLLAGTLVAVKSLKPSVRVVGVEPVGAPTVTNSLRAGQPVALKSLDTVADGLAAPFGAALTQQIIAALVDDIVLLDDEQFVRALRLILERAKLLVEPSGAAGVAALLAKQASVPSGTLAAAILSGGNIDLVKLKSLL
jgi:threonine dehydratase